MFNTVFNLFLEVFFLKIIANFTPQVCQLRYVLEANFRYKWPV